MTISLAPLQASIKIVKGTSLDLLKYGTIFKASRGRNCWFVGNFIISTGCIGKLLFGKVFGKLFAEISLSDFLEVEYGCEDFSKLRAYSILAESSSVI